MARRKHQDVAAHRMAAADLIAQELPLNGAQELTLTDPSTKDDVAAPSTCDDYWARALGKSSVSPVAAPPAAIRRRSETVAQVSPEGAEPAGDTAASYWDRARGVAPRRSLVPGSSAALALPAAAVSVTPEAAQALPVTSADAGVVPAVLAASEPASVPMESQAAAQPQSALRGSHIRKDYTIAVEVSGAHVNAADPLVGAGWEAQLSDDDSLAGAVRGAHVKADDPLAASFCPAHASKTADLVEPSESEVAESAAEAVRAKTRRRRRGVVPVAGAAAAALAAGLGGGAAYAYFHNSGSGSGQSTAGTLIPVTVTAATGTPSTPLVPGGSGDVILQVSNPNAFAVTLVSVSGNGTITAAGGIGTCTTGVTFTNQSSLNDTLNPSTTTQVDLTGAASMSTSSPTGCQGATFSIPVTITVHK